jgi:hypothetical protein
VNDDERVQWVRRVLADARTAWIAAGALLCAALALSAALTMSLAGKETTLEQGPVGPITSGGSDIVVGAPDGTTLTAVPAVIPCRLPGGAP